MLQKIIFAAGAFDLVERAFHALPGVVSTRCGYTGGITDTPTTANVATGRTGHIEAVEIVHDENEIALDLLLAKFWSIHDPTRIANARHRTAIYYFHDAQRKTAFASMALRQKTMMNPILTLIEPARLFWPVVGLAQSACDGAPAGSHPP